MGSLRQYERRAIEEATADSSFLTPLLYKDQQRYYVDTREIFFCGVSPGIGTCSSIKDRDIGVFILGEPRFPTFRAEQPYHYAALVRTLTPEEMETIPVHERNGAFRLAEALRSCEIMADFTRFYLAGSKALFVELV